MNHKFYSDLIRLADPTIKLDGLKPEEIVVEGRQLAAFAVRKLKVQLDAEARLDCDVVGQLSDRQRLLYQALLEIADTFGKYGKEISSEGANYLPPESNLSRHRGLSCFNCRFFAGGGSCAIVQGGISPEGVCRFWLITNESLPQQQGPIFDSGDRAKKYMEWNGLKFGITHRAGEDERHGRIVKASYGFVSGTYGQAEDGMALDVWVGPSLDSKKVFRIEQLKWDGSGFDEYKYVVGCNSAAEAEKLYKANMPAKLFGSIRQVSVDELRPKRKDAGSARQKVVNWNGFSIDITHSPGDRRFQLGMPMSDYYGRIRRSYGAAEDGKAIDVYLSPDYEARKNTRFFRIYQRDPATGMRDESKIMLGYASPDEAVSAYIRHAGPNRFGLIEEVGDELNVYRADSYHADSCGCEACASKTKNSQVEESLEEGEEDPPAKKQSDCGCSGKPQSEKVKADAGDDEGDGVKCGQGWMSQGEECHAGAGRGQKSKVVPIGSRPTQIIQYDARATNLTLQNYVQESSLTPEFKQRIKNHAQAIGDGFKAIDRVHGLGDSGIADRYRIPVMDNLAAKAKFPPGGLASYQRNDRQVGDERFVFNAFSAQSGTSILDPNGRDYADRMALAAVHEFGHFVDFRLINPNVDKRPDIPASEVEGVLDGWRDSVTGTRAIQQLFDLTETDSFTRTTVSGKELTITTDKQFVQYLMEPYEIFARSYSQYVAKKSGNARLKRALDYDRKASAYPAQWEDDDFKPVAKAFDRLFLDLGWRGKNASE